MADEYNTSTNWWDNSSRNRFDSGSSSSSSVLNSTLNSFAWPSEMVDVKTRSSVESASVSDSSIVFHDHTHKLNQQQPQDSSSDLHMMGLGLSSQPIDWNQALLRGGDNKTENSFRSMLQENYQQEWRERVFSTGSESAINEYKQISSRGFSLDHQPQFSPHGGSSSDSTVTCQGLQSSGFQMDYGSPSTMLQGLLLSPDNHHQQQQQTQSSLSYQYGSSATNYGISSNELVPSWSKVTNFLRNSPPKQSPHSQLHFSNNAPFWNASASNSMTDVRSNFFSSSLQPQFPVSNFEEKPKNISEVRDSSSTVVKKSGSEAPTTKRPRNETQSPVPAFKVRKEKMGDRITALQQLVSPFGKTDTASVLSEAIEYIKFLHEQVSVLSTPYMKGGAPIHNHQQVSDKDPDGQKQDLRSRGLCLVPVSSTFPVTHETTVDFWTPTFGGTYR
ncbi:hypothetical protein JCGZ_00754 [Jatropha curcas]|uniref:BHLH domain-containing protein n=1 Tax=Jatropha curcas TaxID=180498 RepID=A0A067KS86_JATCU|nr:hypothetical protein JCGZ_00754 [Jatropha curcas]